MTLRIRGNRDRIVFIHLRGSHTKYTERYTKEFAYFDHTKIPLSYGNNLPEDKKRIIDEYDNSVRFNDHIISSIIKIVKRQNDYSWVLYFSDHGEELFEYRDMLGHQARNYSKYMCEIPFILWVSDKYKAANREDFARMKDYLERPYSTEDVIHSISGLSKLHYADFDKSRSIFSGFYKEYPRLVNGKPYGEVQPLQYARIKDDEDYNSEFKN
jgi:heptose-I-phosphate ethanolaminephosphotransferase